MIICKEKNNNLKIDKHLPQIIVPNNKVQMFIDWWNTDIRFEKSIPHSFNEGYMIIKNLQSDFIDISNYTHIIKSEAKKYHQTYRNIENDIKQFIANSDKYTMYFKFVTETDTMIELYDVNGSIVSRIDFKVGAESEPETELSLADNVKKLTDFDDVVQSLAFIYLGIFASCMWYIATTKRTTKYIYENKVPQITKRSKNIVHVSDTKYITTPIYDMRKIRVVKVESLQTRKKGWTYSHSFEVHGHYRHYKNGKTIFISPFVKGKNKEFKAQTIIIEPK